MAASSAIDDKRLTEPRGRGWYVRIWLLAAFAGFCFGGVLLGLDPIRQPIGYHAFADSRSCLGIPNFANVVSNLPFLLIGIAGIRWVMRWDAALDPELQPAYLVLFAGLIGTSIGSAYYHWAPTSQTLFWDRLPIAVAFMGLFAAVLGERLGPAVGRALLLPLAGYGAASVIYWDATDDLRPYAIAQFFPLLTIPILLALFPARFMRGGDLLMAIGCYAVAKGLEEFDRGIFNLGEFVSGHTLKHLMAALGAWIVVRMLMRRQLVSSTGA